MTLTIHIHTRTRTIRVPVRDTDFRESDHPRRPDGEFAPKGGGESVAKKASSTARTASAVKWTKHGGGEFTPEEHARLRALRIPPAWTQIKLSDDPHAALQVVGRDEKGRPQYRYSAEHSERAAAEKFARLKAFNGVASKIASAAQADMFNSNLTQDQRDAAAVIKLIAVTGFRIGSDKDTKADEKAHGASTLTKEHVTLGRGGNITFSFTGKKGVKITKTIIDHELHRYISGKLKSGGRLFDVPPPTVRAYLKHQGGTEFKVKDFRTWNGTNEALKAISELEPPRTKREFAKFRLEVGRRVGQHLGNTPTVALAAYIDPTVFAKWSHLK